MFFCVQLSGVERVEVAAELDPAYAQTMVQAIAAGVEVIAWRAGLSAEEIVLQQPVSCLQDLPEPAL